MIISLTETGDLHLPLAYMALCHPFYVLDRTSSQIMVFGLDLVGFFFFFLMVFGNTSKGNGF